MTVLNFLKWVNGDYKDFQEKMRELWLDFFQQKILETIDLSKREKEKVLKSKENVEKLINKILYQWYKNLLNNEEILLLIINYKPELLDWNSIIKQKIISKIKKDFSKNKILAFNFIKKLIQEEKNISEINNFIEEVWKDNEEIKNTLQKKLEELLEKYWKISKKQTQKYFLNILNKDLIKLILESKIVNEKWEINENILNNLQKEVNNNFEEIAKNKQKIILFLLEKLNISLEFLQNNFFKNFIEQIFSLLKINKKIEENKENNQESNEKKEQDEDGKKVEEKQELSNNFEEDKELLSFCYPWCVLSEFWNNYEIDLWENQKLEISKQDFNKFNEKSLENYINFLKILRLTNLDFLFKNKYRNDFLIFLQNKYWFDYKNWVGFDENKTLEILTLIWNLIWIPKNYYKTDWELGKFEWIISAINIFWEINSTGLINNKKIAIPGNFIWPTIVEKRMIQLWILWEEWGFSMKKAGELLKKWKLSD